MSDLSRKALERLAKHLTTSHPNVVTITVSADTGTEVAATLRALRDRLDRAEAERDEAMGELSSLSSYLAAGLGDDRTTPAQFAERIRWGVDFIVARETEQCADLVHELSKRPQTTWGEVYAEVKKRTPDNARAALDRIIAEAGQEKDARISALEAELAAARRCPLCGGRTQEIAVKVKPLVWEDGVVDWAKPMPGMKYVACSTTPKGSWAWWLDGTDKRGVEPSEELAKAAAQADWESRARSNIECAPVQSAHPATSEPFVATYRNYRGEVSERTITPKRVWYGSTEWHPEPCWLLTAHDHDKGADRDFALADFSPARPSVAEASKPGALERIVWSAMVWARDNPGGPDAAPEYTDRGNSFAETECRATVQRILRALAGEDGL